MESNKDGRQGYRSGKVEQVTSKIGRPAPNRKEFSSETSDMKPRKEVMKAPGLMNNFDISEKNEEDSHWYQASSSDKSR